MRRLLTLFAGRPDVDFYASSWIDEVWVRTAIAACHHRGMRVRLVLSGGRGAAPPALLVRYAGLGVAVVETSSAQELLGQRMRHVVTASSGIPRSFFGPTLQRLVHMPHSLVSLHMIYPPDAFDSYDTLFAAGPHHAAEWKLLRAAAGRQPGDIRAIGYGKMDLLTEAFEANSESRSRKQILIAPSWGETNLLRIMGPELVRRLLERDVSLVLRPHPSFFLKDEPELAATIAAAGGSPRLILEKSTDIAGTAMFSADVMITDYSGVAFEFAALRKKPTVFVDLPKKVLNARWADIATLPVEVALRSPLGALAAPDIDSVAGAVLDMLDDPPPAEAIGAVVPRFLYERPGVGELAAAEIAAMLEDRR